MVLLWHHYTVNTPSGTFVYNM